MTRPRDALVLGGGVVGCAVAWSLAREGVAVALLERECRLLRKLDHPGIVRVLGFHRADRGAFLTMAHVDGDDIATVLAVHTLAPGHQQAERLGFQCGEVTRMDDGRPQAPQGTPQAQVHARVVARA